MGALLRWGSCFVFYPQPVHVLHAVKEVDMPVGYIVDQLFSLPCWVYDWWGFVPSFLNKLYMC